MLTVWLEALIIKAARQIAAGGKAVFQFENLIQKCLLEKPIQDWEADRWARGVRRRLIRMEGHFFRIGTGKRSCLSLFVRNEQGLHVGLRRESITQAATFVTLITDYGYSRESTRYETGWMDVAVFGENKKPTIYAENKAAERTLLKLCTRLESEFETGIPFPDPDVVTHDDALMKAQHIWLHRPVYFWGVCPTLRRSFQVSYNRQGFRLAPAADIPCFDPK